MKIVIVNKSDSTGGAAVVSRRLMEALRAENIDVHMLVTEKLSDSPYVVKAGSDFRIKRAFLMERIKIFIANGFNRSTLFKIDTGEEGLPLWKHPLVKKADAILLNWVNQGMLSLKGVKKLLSLGKPVIWTMHDMWCMTGICHHAGNCNRFMKECGNCPLLGSKANPHDLSFKVHTRKKRIYNSEFLTGNLAFVAVSSWLKEKSRESSLLDKMKVEVIPNAFDLKAFQSKQPRNSIRIIFGAARLDDPIKGLDIFRETSRILKEKYPEETENLEIAFFGGIKNPEALEGFSLPVVKLGMLHGEKEVEKAYWESDIVVSASSYETLPGTLVEGQAYGCIPVSFNQGGQTDIVDHLSTGYIAAYDEDLRMAAQNLAEGVVWAVKIIRNREAREEILSKMHKNVSERFSYREVARRYIGLVKEMATAINRENR